MADDISVTPGSGATVAADDVGGKLHQRIKLTWGPDGTGNDTDAASGKALPVQFCDSGGTEILTAAQVVSLLGKLDTLHTDLATTLGGYLDGVEGKLDTLHTDLATTLAGYVDGLEALVGTTNSNGTSTNTKLDTLHSDLGSTLDVALDTGTIRNGATALTPKFTKIAVSSSGATTVVALVSAKKIRVLAAYLSPNAAVNIKFQSHATPTDLTGLHYATNQGNGLVLPFNPVGWFETVAGEALDINLSGAVAVGGTLVYVEV
ncbi:hypothetical protein QIH87_49865 (plasmid) [Bradyrhizobium elkanii]|jgi:hypothetical protein|uniref:hypothetical protein n=1 Tax=Bradyrhizobium elkanii TaxID=29448 RepID=UPI0022263CE1|nr:hypothetical protein [Bradyrhizobium elkanii]MCW2228085.1 hypothetical protein [Bradyrhizobium elkanii]WLB14837.1 hypothetical protein QIH87_49865 [Bradyrhizobium elkanii]WLB69071.1 hypothetical protein QIH89_27540 [Bradyrhizobium elkanii]